MSNINKVRQQRDRYIRAMEVSNDALNKQLQELQANLSAATRYLGVLVDRNGGSATITRADLDGVNTKTFNVSFAEDGTATFTVIEKVETETPEPAPADEATQSQPLAVEVQPPMIE